MRKITILVLLVLFTLPTLGQQHRMSMNVAFDKNEKCLIFTFKNNSESLKAVLKNGHPEHNIGNFFSVTAYDQNNNKIGYANSMFHPGGLILLFSPEETIKTTIDLKYLMDQNKNKYIADLNGIYKIKLHCIVRSFAYIINTTGTYEKYEKDYTFYWE